MIIITNTQKSKYSPKKVVHVLEATPFSGLGSVKDVWMHQLLPFIPTVKIFIAFFTGSNESYLGKT